MPTQSKQSKQHATEAKPETHTETEHMPAKTTTKTKSTVITTPIPVTTTTSPPMPVTTIPTTTTTAPATTSSPVVLPTAPPDVDLPTPPDGWSPIPLTEFRGSHPSAAQVAAVPAVATELSASDAYTQALGPIAPSKANFVQTLIDAAGWTGIRIALETYLLYAKSQEGIAWKAGRTQIEQVKAVYDVALTQNAQLPVMFPALARLLGLSEAIGKKAAATRVRNLKANAKGATVPAAATPAIPPATGATPAPAANPSAAPSGSGGAAH